MCMQYLSLYTVSVRACVVRAYVRVGPACSAHPVSALQSSCPSGQTRTSVRSGQNNIYKEPVSMGELIDIGMPAPGPPAAAPPPVAA